MRAPWFLALLVILGLTADAARADDEVPATPESPMPSPATVAAPPEEATSGNLVGDVLRDVRRGDRGLYRLGLGRTADRIADRVERRIGLRFAAAYTMLYQHADRGNGPKDAWGGDLDIVGIWKPRGQREGRDGSLQISLEGRHRIETEIAPQSLSKTIDSLWPTVSGFNEQEFSVTQLYWGQNFLRGRLRIRFGKISPYFFFGNRLNDVNTAFLNASFSDSPAVFFPGNGLGLQARYRFDRGWIVRAGIQNANGVKTELLSHTIEDGEFWYGFEVEKEVRIRRLGLGRYRFGGWYVDARSAARRGDGAGTSISFDQEIGKRVLVFLRGAWQGSNLITQDVQEDSLTGTKRALRVGLGVDGPLPKLARDYFGIAVAWGEPSFERARDALVGECFYRMQVTDAAHLSASLQVIRSSTIFDEVLVFGLRFRVEF